MNEKDELIKALQATIETQKQLITELQRRPICYQPYSQPYYPQQWWNGQINCNTQQVGLSQLAQAK